MARKPFKLRSGNSTLFKLMGSSPLRDGDKAFDQKKIKIQTRENPNTGETEKRATGYDASIDDIRKAKLITAAHDDMTNESNYGTRSGVTEGGPADKLGYSGRSTGAMMGNKGMFESKYNVGNEKGKYASKLGTRGRDIDIDKHIIKTNKGASKLVKPINSSVEAESTTKGLKLNTNKKKKSKATNTSTKSKKVDYAKSQLTVKKK